MMSYSLNSPPFSGVTAYARRALVCRRPSTDTLPAPSSSTTELSSKWITPNAPGTTAGPSVGAHWSTEGVLRKCWQSRSRVWPSDTGEGEGAVDSVPLHIIVI